MCAVLKWEEETINNLHSADGPNLIAENAKHLWALEVKLKGQSENMEVHGTKIEDGSFNHNR